jgi:hypothetical protein
VFDLMTKWIERYRQRAQERYERLDLVLAEMRGDQQADRNDHRPRSLRQQQGDNEKTHEEEAHEEAHEEEAHEEGAAS